MTEQQHGLDFWRERLAGVQLPMLSGADAREALLLPTASLQELGRLLLADAPLALDVLRAAARVSGRRDDVQGLQHALAMLGVERVQAIARVRMKRLFDPAVPGHAGVAQALAVARFAGLLVDAWEVNKVPGNSDFLPWVIQLLGFARAKLPLAAPALWREIEARVAAGEHRARVEHALLGVPIGELNHALLLHGGFTDDEVLAGSLQVDGAQLAAAARHAWEGPFAPELPAPLARWLRGRNLRAALAYLLAWSAWDGWYSRRTLGLMRVVSAALGQPLDRVITTTHQVAVRASRGNILPGGLRTPAESLFWPALPPRRVRRPAAPLAPARTPTPAQPSPAQAPPQLNPGEGRQPDMMMLAAFVGNCRDGHYRALLELVTSTRQVLADGLGLTRCMLFLQLAQSPDLVCYLAEGFEPPVASRTLAVPVEAANLVTRVFKESGSLQISPARVEAARRQLPPTLQALVHANGFLLSGVRIQSRPVGVLWADSGPGAAAGAAQYAAFRRLAQHFGAAFARLAEQRRA